MVAVESGGQLAAPLRTDARVVVQERTNVRDLTRRSRRGPVDLTVADLSFISLPCWCRPLAAAPTRTAICC